MISKVVDRLLDKLADAVYLRVSSRIDGKIRTTHREVLDEMIRKINTAEFRQSDGCDVSALQSHAVSWRDLGKLLEGVRDDRY